MLALAVLLVVLVVGCVLIVKIRYPEDDKRTVYHTAIGTAALMVRLLETYTVIVCTCTIIRSLVRKM